jgi:para-nitrobenzyl esterase
VPGPKRGVPPLSFAADSNPARAEVGREKHRTVLEELVTEDVKRAGLDRRTVLGAAGAAAVVAGAGPVLAQGAAPVATTAYGQIRGLNRGPVKVFLGVPYGADTGGANRWLPPKPPARWTGIRDTVEYGPAPPQGQPIAAPMQEETDMLQTGPIGEDCLRLNIYTPAVGANSGKRAVMVWFHGGGFQAGSGNATSYDGSNLARKQDVVVVSVTHRLNNFGYLYLADLFGPTYADSGNVGQLDLIAALRWVRDNISNFGGDPSRVMIFGQSGGGGKVSTLMGMPPAKGLFHRAAAQSGAAVRSTPKETAAANAKRLVDALGVKTVAEMQALPWQKIVEVAAANRGAGATGPVVDGTNLPANVFDPMASPLSRDVPLISSTTETESASWGASVDPLDDAGLLAQVTRSTRLSEADAQALIGVYKAAYPGKDNTYLGQLMMSQWTFNDNVLTQAERKAAQAAQGGAPDYFFYFAHHADVRDGKLHAPHTSEIPYVWDSLAASKPMVGEITPAKQALADKCSAYWANFAKTGDPNGAGLTRWEPFTLETRATLVVSPDDKFAMVNDPWGTTRKAVAEYKAKAGPAGPGGPRAG